MTMKKRVGRLEGRLFSEDGYLFMVIAVDDDTGMAQVTCRVAGTRQVIPMTIDDVYDRISSERSLILDNLNSAETLRRVYEGDGGWFFVSREGDKGPFPSKDIAANQLCRYILSMQTQPRDRMAADDAPPRPSPRRRADDHAAPLRAAG